MTVAVALPKTVAAAKDWAVAVLVIVKLNTTVFNLFHCGDISWLWQYGYRCTIFDN